MSKATYRAFMLRDHKRLAESFHDRPLIYIGLIVWLAALLVTGLLAYFGFGLAENMPEL